MTSIPFIDLKAQRARLGERIDRAVLNVIESAGFILGPEVTALEEELAAFCGAKHCVSCANGTDALALALMARGVGRGDAVFVPAFTFVATAEVAAWVGATPVFVDVLEDTFNMDPASLLAAVLDAEQQGLRPAVVIPVDLFGQPADYDAIEAVAREHGLFVLADTAQGFGAAYRGRRTGAIGEAAATSFFPAKPLGCYGDGGAVFTGDDELAAVMRSIRMHGQGAERYDNVRIGLNSRLDAIQAAVLREKLAIFPDEIKARDRIAQRYTAALSDVARTPVLAEGTTSVWAQYTLVVDDRAEVARTCKDAGVPTAVYYPIPLSRQSGYSRFPTVPGGVPVSERLSERVISLPMHPYLDEPTQNRVIEAVRAALARV